MDTAQTWRARVTRFLHRYHARKAAKAAIQTHFVTDPEPRTIGHFARGRQLASGNFLFAGTFNQAPATSIWDIEPDNPLVVREVQGCDWLDDLAAVGDVRARAKAQAWVLDWIERYGTGDGMGWLPNLTGRRLIRWINHAAFLQRGQNDQIAEKFLPSLGHQTLFLSKRWRATAPGLARFEAIVGTIIAGLALDGFGEIVPAAVEALATECDAQVNEEGGVPTRNPEHLLEIFTLVTWAFQSLSDAGQSPPAQLHAALSRMAPTLRALRHADGGLARFHGGGRGIEGRLDHALADSKVRVAPSDKDRLHMGYARISAGRTSLIVDASVPPQGPASTNGHASTLAFELTSGRRPLIVNCGSGHSFGSDWRRAGRATPSHSTLCLGGMSSSRLAKPVNGRITKEELTGGPQEVRCEFSLLDDGRRLELSHDGYRPDHGLTHARVIDVAHDGRSIVGEDYAAAVNEPDKKRFWGRHEAHSEAVTFNIRFHLHPDVDATVDLSGNAVSMVLKSGEVWVFRHDGAATLALEPSVYLESGRLKPRAAQQVVLSSAALDYANRVRWSFAKAQDTPDAVRDLNPVDPADG
ncbi:MAG: heparinase II/III family protein [Pseudomonadota bacterium]